MKAKLPSIQPNDNLCQRTLTEPFHPKWAALSRLCERPWFSRLWVIQEVVLASKLPQFLCGSRVVPWADFQFVLSHLERVRGLPLLSPDPLPPDNDFEMHTRRLSEGWRLLVIVNNLKLFLSEKDLDMQRALQYVTATSKATDPRDKIYGLYGIAQGVNDSELTPDYNKSIEDVYIQTTRHLISKSKSLELLVDAGVDYKNNIQLPSWVPNYSIPPQTGRIAFVYPGENIFKASGLSSPIIHWTAGSNDLTLSGAIIDNVEYLGTSSTNMTGTELRVWMLEAFSLVRLYNEKGPGAISNEDLWRTMIGNRSRNLSPVDAAYSTVFESFKHWVQSPEDFMGMEKHHPDTYIGRAYRKVRGCASASAEITTKRKFGISRDGRPGILPSSTAVGDQVAIILGLSTPFILRKCAKIGGNTREQKYVLVGECYLHSLMNGEGLQGKEVEKLIFQ